MKATPLKGQTDTSRGQHATELERRLSDAALNELKRRYPTHTDKLGARDADCTVDIIKSARKRGRLPLRHVVMLAATWGPDVWRTIFEPIEETLAEAARIEARARKHLSQEQHQQLKDNVTNS